jgi:cytosine/adenosine deaminase-related metal-dependent hydrolase
VPANFVFIGPVHPGRMADIAITLATDFLAARRVLRPRRCSSGEIVDTVWIAATLLTIWGTVLFTVIAALFR